MTPTIARRNLILGFPTFNPSQRLELNQIRELQSLDIEPLYENYEFGLVSSPLFHLGLQFTLQLIDKQSISNKLIDKERDLRAQLLVPGNWESKYQQWQHLLSGIGERILVDSDLLPYLTDLTYLRHQVEHLIELVAIYRIEGNKCDNPIR